MRLVIDLQGAQTRSRFRGIGRYTRSLTAAILEQHPHHDLDVILLFNGLFPDSIEPLQKEFMSSSRSFQSVTWHAPGPLDSITMGNEWRFAVADLLRSEVVRCLKADWFLESSIFDGFIDDAVTEIEDICSHTRVSTIFYDVIPLIYARNYLDPYPRFAEFYRRKAQQLQHSDLLFAISDAAKNDGLAALALNADRIVNISSGVDPAFTPATDDAAAADTPRRAQPGHYILYTGGADERKNIPGLLKAYSRLPVELRRRYSLVFAGRLEVSEQRPLEKAAKRLGIPAGQLRFTGFVDDRELIELYRGCRLFVFPSWHEGFGLPPLEAIRCGAVTIAGDRSSLPEVVGVADSLFDPFDIDAMSSLLKRALEDEDFRERVAREQQRHAGEFSWHRSASRAIKAWLSPAHNETTNETTTAGYGPGAPTLIDKIGALPRETPPDERLLAQIAYDISRNRDAVQPIQ